MPARDAGRRETMRRIPHGRDRVAAPAGNVRQLADPSVPRRAATPRPDAGEPVRAPLAAARTWPADRKSVVKGKSVQVRVDLGGCRIIKKKQNTQYNSL